MKNMRLSRVGSLINIQTGLATFPMASNGLACESSLRLDGIRWIMNSSPRLDASNHAFHHLLPPLFLFPFQLPLTVLLQLYVSLYLYT